MFFQSRHTQLDGILAAEFLERLKAAARAGLSPEGEEGKEIIAYYDKQAPGESRGPVLLRRYVPLFEIPQGEQRK